MFSHYSRPCATSSCRAQQLALRVAGSRVGLHGAQRNDRHDLTFLRSVNDVAATDVDADVVSAVEADDVTGLQRVERNRGAARQLRVRGPGLLYTSDAADE